MCDVTVNVNPTILFLIEPALLDGDIQFHTVYFLAVKRFFEPIHYICITPTPKVLFVDKLRKVKKG